jgi:hypothetical protein
MIDFLSHQACLGVCERWVMITVTPGNRSSVVQEEFLKRFFKRFLKKKAQAGYFQMMFLSIPGHAGNGKGICYNSSSPL